MGETLIGDVNRIGVFIDGGLHPSKGESLFDVVNPSNGQLLFSMSAGDAADANGAVAAARRSFEDGRWRSTAPSFRKMAMHRFADTIAAQASVLDALDAEEMGKPIALSRFNAECAAGLMRFYAECIDKVTGDVLESDAWSFVALRCVPRGVVAAIVPWNF